MRVSNILSWLHDNGIENSFEGDGSKEILGFSSLSNYKDNSITWIKNEEAYYNAGKPSGIACAVVSKGVEVDFDNAIIVNDSKEVFFKILNRFWHNDVKPNGIGNGSIVSEQSSIDKSAIIGNNCTIEGSVFVGAGTIIENNVVIQGRVKIGRNCIIHSGAVIGADGFGYYYEVDGTLGKVEHFGGVVINDNVEIGANACIDRGTIDDTIIGENTKIDNLVHIAHNVQIGKNVCIVAGAVVCGSSTIKDMVYIAPGGIIKNQLVIGEHAFVGLGGVVIQDVDEAVVVAGVPAKTISKTIRQRNDMTSNNS